MAFTRMRAAMNSLKDDDRTTVATTERLWPTFSGTASESLRTRMLLRAFFSDLRLRWKEWGGCNT